MFHVERSRNNPLIASDNYQPWRQLAAFNPSPAAKDGKLHLIYRAMTDPMLYHDQRLSLSSIGHVVSDETNSKDLGKHSPLIAPTEDWELFGCEDPRVTLVDDTYYIFYTAIS